MEKIKPNLAKRTGILASEVWNELFDPIDCTGFSLYWGVREEGACFELDKSTQTIASLKNGSFYPVIQHPTEGWNGKTGIVHQVVMADIDDLSNYDIYLAGRFDMVATVRDDFIARGVKMEQMYADAFAFI